MISVITPTHDPKLLRRAWESLEAQDYRDFEWVVAVNGDCTEQAAMAAIDSNDDRIRVVRLSSKAGCVGEIKRDAFSAGRGDILLELDHDDELEPGALAGVVLAMRDPNIDFAYSDCLYVPDNGAPVPHEALRAEWEACGWRFSEWDGAPYPRSFYPSAAALSLIYYAPNHLRAWRASFYREIGGHDAGMTLCDDHDLLIRTYLHGNMVKIGLPLYRYHMTGENTWAKAERMIRETTYGLMRANLEALVKREMDLRNLPCIDLGGAFGCPSGWTPVDREGACHDGDDEICENGALFIKRDLNVFPWPFANGTVGAFRAHDILEHLPDKQAVMAEIHRCLAPGGWLLSNTPSTDGRGAFQDPTHVSYWNENAFWYWTRETHAKYVRNREVRFQEALLETWYPNEFCRVNKIPYVRACLIKLPHDADLPLPGITRI